MLPGGALEHYLPAYRGNRYSLEDAAKRTAVETEVSFLSTGAGDSNLEERYGILFRSIVQLPAKAPIDTDAILVGYLADYVHRLQGLVITHLDWKAGEFNAHFAASATGIGKLFQITEFARVRDNEFSATIGIDGTEKRMVRVSHETNAGMRRFTIETV